MLTSPTGHTCVICQEPIFGSEIRAPCGHHYDIACVTELFQASTRDETLYPPRCCRQNIPVAQVRPHLSQALVTEFEQKGEEFGTLKCVYCSSPTCSRFLGALSEGIWNAKIYACPAPGCRRRTCGSCRGEYSGLMSHICRNDADAAQVLMLGRDAGWSRCPGCSQMIELNVGCFHMTCRCRTEFCYLCRARWKTCTCPQWDERLLAAAEQRVDAQLEAGQGNHTERETVRQRMVRETMERLRVDHDCNHGHWQYRKGGGRCETCGHNLPYYLFRCKGCEMLACNRCRRNRL
ncbi:hypothetical protein PAXRUDRAFT_146502 [Paxillus rubicundulus Ve08.2h10]|uniref:RBR-type E3 ubiquitin transferase n=1 Tax=Paxillus rubicundulus Ve08.2h10 TaxID=930991 RepID=A0A0D0D7E1_9AGAM|nr:hypothetical protein PAXRUDRAFT_146502 [Paxillus rubicundulus Ve08.2h10]